MTNIIETTRNIIKSLDKNTTLLFSIFKKYYKYKNTSSSDSTASKGANIYLAKFLKAITDVELLIAKSKKADTEDRNDVKDIIQNWLSRLRNIYSKVSLSSSEKKYVSILINYFDCICTYIKNNNIGCPSSFDPAHCVSSDKSCDKCNNASCSSDNLFIACSNKSYSSSSSSSLSHKLSCESNNSSTDASSCELSSSDCECVDASGCCIKLNDLVKLCKDSTNIKLIQDKLCCLEELFKMIKTIICQLDKQFIDQLVYINCKNPNDIAEVPDYDFVNKMIELYGTQYNNISNNHCGSIFDCTNFDPEGDNSSVPTTVTIKVDLCCDKCLEVCIIDNLCSAVDTDTGKFSVFIGEIFEQINFIAEGSTYGEMAETLKLNSASINHIKTGLNANCRIVQECIDTLNYLVKCGLPKTKLCC
jgi:hypothetical protein